MPTAQLLPRVLTTLNLLVPARPATYQTALCECLHGTTHTKTKLIYVQILYWVVKTSSYLILLMALQGSYGYPHFFFFLNKYKNIYLSKVAQLVI